MRLFKRSFVVVAAYTLLLPAFGAVLDHHFAERQMEHAHIYPGEMPVEHLHPYETPHAHGEAQDASGGLDATGPQSGILFLPPDDDGATGPSGLSLAATLLGVLIVLVVPPTLTRLIPSGQEAFSPFVPRLEPPPPRPAL